MVTVGNIIVVVLLTGLLILTAYISLILKDK